MNINIQDIEKAIDKQEVSQLGVGKSFGTFGELLQGVRENGEDFLVTFPINKFSNAKFISKLETNQLTVTPESKKTSLTLAKMLIDHYGLLPYGELIIESELPVGKGFASSSADMVATARAIEDCFGMQIEVTLLQELMSKLETSDGVMYPGVVSFYNKRVKLIEAFSFLPPLTIVGVDEGGEVDTLNYHKVPKNYTSDEKVRYEQLLDEMTHALRKMDLEAITRVSTESAYMNQRFNPLKALEKVSVVCHKVGGLGVIKAHTGTYCGLILSAEDANYNYKLEKAINLLEKDCSDVSVFYSLSS